MKSPNVLVWHFPSPQKDGNRLEQTKLAGNVWLKVADYGISQVATASTMKLLGAVGTPGYMAPELFHTGQQVSSEKVCKRYCITVRSLVLQQYQNEAYILHAVA